MPRAEIVEVLPCAPGTCEGAAVAPREMMMFIGTHSVTTTLNVHSLSRSLGAQAVQVGTPRAEIAELLPCAPGTCEADAVAATDSEPVAVAV